MNIQDQIKEQRALLDTLIKEVSEAGIPMTEEQEKRHSEIKAKIVNLEQLQALENDKLALENKELRAKAEEAEKEDKEYKEKQMQTIVETPEKTDAEKSYRDAFNFYLRTGDQSEFRTVTDYQNKTTSADGGYLAPALLYNEIVKKRDEVSIIRKIAKVMPITRDVNIPVEGSDLQGSWVAEGGAISYTKQAFAQKELKLQKFVAKVGITEEMLADSAFDLDVYLAEKIARVFATNEETAFIKGTAASNQPVGILSSGITTTRTATATAVVLDDVIELYEALGSAYRPNASWIISPAMEAVLIKLTTGSGGVSLWQPSLVAGTPNTLLGRPVYVSSDLDTTIAANKYQAIFGDFSYYMIGDKGGVEVKRYDNTDVDGTWAIRGCERVGGIVTNTDAFKILQCKAS